MTPEELAARRVDPNDTQTPKRAQLFFRSDVEDCIDYVEHMAEKFAYPGDFMRAVAKSLTASACENLTEGDE